MISLQYRHEIRAAPQYVRDWYGFAEWFGVIRRLRGLLRVGLVLPLKASWFYTGEWHNTIYCVKSIIPFLTRVTFAHNAAF